MPLRPLARRAFTLIEMSIVLVIIGLLVGGILGGQALIRASELRGLVSEYTLYTTAVSTFREKYDGLPGDLRNATKYWGAATGATTEGVVAACANLVTPYTDQKTCNGNGNGKIAENDSDNNGTDDRLQWYEMYRAWQQLSNAGLISGIYKGGTSRTAWNANPGYNVPKSKAGNDTGWVIRHHPELDEWLGWYYKYKQGTYLYVGTGDEGSEPGITPEEAWSIDTKFDDGKPAYGTIKPMMSNLNPGCLDADTLAAEYLVSSGDIACTLSIYLPM